MSILNECVCGMCFSDCFAPVSSRLVLTAAAVLEQKNYRTYTQLERSELRSCGPVRRINGVCGVDSDH